MPFRANPKFTGRDGQLVQIREALTSGARTQVVTGLGGVGKTQLATEYAHRHRDDYHIVCWLAAEDSSSIIAGLVELGSHMRLVPDGRVDERAAAESVRSQLQEEEDWLLVFDNADDLSTVRDFIPGGGHGHILVTSQNPAWRSIVEPIALGPLDRAASIEFLGARTGHADEAGASDLAGELGDLPLALEQAGAYMEQTGVDFQAYHQLFQTRRDELWEREPPPREHQATVRVTVELARNRASQLHSAASELLDLLAYFASDRIPLFMLAEDGTSYSASLGEVLSDPFTRNDVLAALLRYSLVEREGTNLTIHRLVQAAARSSQAPSIRQHWVLAAVKLLAHAFPANTQDVVNWPRCEVLMPHVLSIAERMREIGVESVYLVALLNNSSDYLIQRARLQEALPQLEPALEMNMALSESPAADETAYETELREQFEWSLPTLLGQVLRKLDRFDDARVQLERSLELVTERYGAEDIRAAKPLEVLGTLAGAEGKLVLAREHLERGLAIRRKHLGERHRDVAITLNNLGTILLNLGLFERADAAYTEALAIIEEHDGPDHLSAATTRMNLGNLRHQRGDDVEAEKLYRRALEIEESHLDPEHPDLATALIDIAIALRGRGELADAEAHVLRALQIDQAAFGEEHSVLARDLNNLAAVLIEGYRFNDALPHLERALAIVVKVHGPTSWQQVTQLANLAEVHSSMGQPERAVGALERALLLVEAELPSGHPTRAGLMTQMAGLRFQAGAVSEAVRLQTEALGIFSQALGHDHPKTVVARHLLSIFSAEPKGS